jgi:hypothetical protein
VKLDKIIFHVYFIVWVSITIPPAHRSPLKNLVFENRVIRKQERRFHKSSDLLIEARVWHRNQNDEIKDVD